jgi:hypothetical protein
MVDRVREACEACFGGHKGDDSASTRSVASELGTGAKNKTITWAGTSGDRVGISHPEHDYEDVRFPPFRNDCDAKRTP